MTDSDEVKLLPCEDELVELVAKALLAWEFPSDKWEAIHPASQDMYREMAAAAIAPLLTRPPAVTDEVVDALAVARADLTHLGERYGMQEFVAPTICRINAALASMPAVVSGGQT